MKARKTVSEGICSGQYTIEAVFIFPLIVAILLLTVFYGLYLHDKVAIDEMGLYYAKQALHLLKEPVTIDGDLEIKRLEEQNILRTDGYGKHMDVGAVEARFYESAKNRLILSDLESVKIDIGEKSIAVSYAGSYRMKALTRFLSLLGIAEKFYGHAEMERTMDPEEFLRLCRGIIWRE